MRFVALSVVLAAAFAAFAPAAAQPTEEELLERERRYLERYVKGLPDEEPDATADEEAEQQDRVEKLVATADRLIQDQNHTAHGTAHYHVQTDDPRLRAERVAELLERFRDAFVEFWDVTAEPDAEPVRVYLFYSRYKYRQMPGIETRVQGDSAGHYSPVTGMLVIHSDPFTESQLQDTVIHEAAHQLLADLVFPPAPPAPTWIQEGMASFFGNSAIDRDGEFHFGVIGHKRVASLAAGQAWSGGSWVPANRALRSFKRFLREHREFTVGDVVRAGPEQYYSEAAPLYYTAAWLLCSYLLEGEGGRHRPHFVRYLEEAGWIDPGPERLARELGITVERLDTDWKTYVDRR